MVRSLHCASSRAFGTLRCCQARVEKRGVPALKALDFKRQRCRAGSARKWQYRSFPPIYGVPVDVPYMLFD